ncbi:MAG: MFS transporter [Candidatus Limnocylindrales bacterium]|nr:MFS transporter [Candidatus Limnocylindrales bacterium]
MTGATGSSTPVRGGWVLFAVVLGSGVVFLDSTVVNVALQTIGQELPAIVVGRLEGLTYVTSGYLTVLAALLVLAGALGDAFGRRRIFAIGLVGFGVTSVVCGLAPTLEALVVARLAQGAAGALLVPQALAIITATWEGEARGRAIGTWAAATSAFVIAGPLVGGVLVQAVSWRAVFFVNVPIVVIGTYALRYLPESRDEDATGRFDWLGAAVIAVGVGGLAFGATRGEQQRWQDPVAFVAILVGAAAVALFPWLMSRRRDPLVPLDLFRSRAFSVINLSTFVIYGALYVNLAFQQLYLQGVLGYSPTAAALALLPPAILLTLVSTRAGRLAGRLGARRFLVAGPLLMAAGLLYLARVPSTSAAWSALPADPASFLPSSGYLVDILPGQLVYGIGLAILVAPLSTALMGSVPARRAGLASAINNAVSRAGAPLVSALLFIALSAAFYPALAALVPGIDVGAASFRAAVQPLTTPDPSLGPAVAAAAREASTTAFHLAMIAAAALLAVGAAVNGFGLRSAIPAAAGRPPQEPEGASPLSSA